MKKIIAVILALACCFAIFACKEEEKTAVDYTNEYYAASLPTKIVTNTVQTAVDEDGVKLYELKGNYVLTTGKIAGKIATVQTYEQDVLRTVDEGSNALIVGPIKTELGTEEYLQGYGRRTNGSDWRASGLNFGPVMGSIAINITNDNVKDVTYTEEKFNNKLSFTVALDKVGEVFGTDDEGNPAFVTDTDVQVVITNNGATVTGITLSYSVEAYDEYPARDVTVSTVYTYAVEEINLLY